MYVYANCLQLKDIKNISSIILYMDIDLAFFVVVLYL